MKKSIIVLALALLMVGSVFAGEVAAITKTGEAGATDVLTKETTTTVSPDTKKTDVKIQLKQYPKYMAAITAVNYDGSTNKISNASTTGYTTYTDVKHQNEIVLTVNKDTWTIGGPTTQYYYTYYAYENTQNVQYSITMNGNLTYQDGGSVETGDTQAPTWSGDTTSATADKQKQIRYSITIPVNGVNTTIYSYGTADGTTKNTAVVKQIPLTKLIGKSEYGSLAMTFAGCDTVQYNIVGNYKATVTIKVSAY